MTIRKFAFLFPIFLALAVELQSQIPATKYSVGSVTFEGNNSFSYRQLRRLIKLKSSWLPAASEFNRRSLKLDALTLKNFYVSQGFLKVEIEDSFKIRDNNVVDILFKISEGERSYLRTVYIEGSEFLPERKIIRILGLKVGKPFNPIGLRQRFSELEREYGKIGKLYLSVDSRYTPGKDIDLYLSLEEGPDVLIDKIVLKGLTRVDSAFVFREIAFDTASVYNEELIELSQRQIFETGLFSLVNITPTKSQRGAEWVNTLVEIREFKTTEILIEPGISRIRSSSEGGEPISGLEGTAQILNRGVFGSGARFGMKGSIQLPLEAHVNPLGVAIFRSEMNITNLWISRWRAPNTLRLFAERAPELLLADKLLMRFGVEWRGLHKFSEESILRGGLKWTEILTEDAAKRESQQERSLSLSYRYRKLDNIITPTRGGSFSLESSIVGWILGGTQDYYRIEADIRRFVHLGYSRVLAARVKMGRMERLNSKARAIPAYDQFYLGGSTSLRGWRSQRFHTYTEEDDQGKKVKKAEGGLIKILVNTEVRIPIWWIFGVDIFVDGGILVSNTSKLAGQIEHWSKGEGWNYGIELAIGTPLGPIRLYYAVPFKNPRGGIPNLGVPYAF